MSSSSFGQGPKKETMYSGPAPSTQGTVYSGPSATGTDYNGGATGTVYRPSPQATPGAGKTGASAPTHAAGNLFLAIAGLSVVNSALALAKAPLAIAFGLGITRVFDTLVRQGGAIGPAMVANLVAVTIFALIGYFARQGSRAAILIGIVLYAVDTASLFLFSPILIISILIHGYFLFALFGAYRAARS